MDKTVADGEAVDDGEKVGIPAAGDGEEIGEVETVGRDEAVGNGRCWYRTGAIKLQKFGT